MPQYNNHFSPSYIHQLRLIFLSLLFYSTPSFAQVASYAPAARSATSANTMLDNVVGNRHSPVKTQTNDSGALYHVAEDGTVTAPNGLIVNAGCLGKSGPVPEIRSKYRFASGRRGKGFETILIGVSSEPARSTLNSAATSKQTVRRATLNASFGPTNLYVLPRPCAHKKTTDKILTDDAAAALAAADGNAFTLAGNRDNVENVNAARIFLNGDVQLLSAPTIRPSIGKTSP